MLFSLSYSIVICYWKPFCYNLCWLSIREDSSIMPFRSFDYIVLWTNKIQFQNYFRVITVLLCHTISEMWILGTLWWATCDDVEGTSHGALNVHNCEGNSFLSVFEFFLAFQSWRRHQVKFLLGTFVNIEETKFFLK